jgi:hypothetical protein
MIFYGLRGLSDFDGAEKLALQQFIKQLLQG